MSDETRTVLTEAIRGHLTDETGGYLTDWYVVAAGADGDVDSTTYIYEASGSPYHTTLGLLEAALHQHRVEYGPPGD